jgi:hypothetical protein
MSLRPEISGFKLNKLLSLFNCKKAIVLEKAKKHFSKFVGVENNPQNTRPFKILEQIISGKITRSNTKVENSDFILVIILLASFEQKRILTNSNIYKSDSLYNYFKFLKPKLSKKTFEMLNFLLSGRPLMGKVFNTEWSYYAYLTNEEVDSILKELTALSIATKDPENFGKVFIKWLRQIKKLKSDLWYYAN